MKPNTAIDLFCGAGGLTLGLKQAGFHVVGGVENDPLAADTYRANHPEVRLWEQDIQSLTGQMVLQDLHIEKGKLDLLAGCPPCQGFSRMRTLNGRRKVDDSRNDLVFELLRFVKDLMPRAVMMENVPGLCDDIRIRQFADELRSLEYECDYGVVNAADYGVPQRRRRMILLAGWKTSIPFAEPVFKKRTVRQTIGRMPPAGESGDPLHDMPENRSDRIETLIDSIPRDGGSRTDLDDSLQLPCHRRSDGFKDVYGRMAWDDVAPTITSGCFNPSKGRFLHPEANRAITMREAALLQGFPRDYEFSVRRGKAAVALMIGNALPPPFIRRHATIIADRLSRGGR